MLRDAKRPAISVVLCTWNRASLLGEALVHLLEQSGDAAYEVVVVDNASTDRTRSLVTELAAHDSRVRYVHEPRQGLSHARNTGIASARADVIAFTDDDVRVGVNWVESLRRAFDAHPDAACIGGPVLPAWPRGVPRWLTERHWAPLGIQDYGPRPLRVDQGRPLCLIGANLACRRNALAVAGLFDPAVQRVADALGSTEDHALHIRLWKAGLHGVYVPEIAVSAAVLPDRLRKQHHRRWHFGHGRHIARMKLDDIERGRRRLADIPGHLVTQAAVEARAWMAALLRGDTAAAFDHEVRLWFVAGYARERWA